MTSRIDIIGSNGGDGEIYHWLHKHGHRPKGNSSPTYITWVALKSRCNDEDNPNYGGKGISYDPRWVDFIEFLADMGDRPEGCTIDRVDADKDYYKGNCRWASQKEQAQNRNNTIFLTHEGETLCLLD